jgi:benzoyl-CoA reductase subunit A
LILVDGQIFAFSNFRTGSNSPESANKAMDGAMKDTGMELKDLQYTVGTGYGRVNVPFANRAITEIACHARGANFMAGPKIRTVLDMGGQDCKAILCDERGKVSNFLMNDKCAAGTGRGMEVMADLLSIPIKDIGDLSFQVEKQPPEVSSTCVVFAKSEALGLMRSGWSKNMVLASYCSAMAHRISLLLGRIGVQEQFFITGGIAKNPGVVKRLEEVLGMKTVTSEHDSQIAGALGAALFADTLIQKGAN